MPQETVASPVFNPEYPYAIWMGSEGRWYRGTRMVPHTDETVRRCRIPAPELEPEVARARFLNPTMLTWARPYACLGVGDTPYGSTLYWAVFNPQATRSNPPPRINSVNTGDPLMPIPDPTPQTAAPTPPTNAVEVLECHGDFAICTSPAALQRALSRLNNKAVHLRGVRDPASSNTAWYAVRINRDPDSPRVLGKIQTRIHGVANTFEVFVPSRDTLAFPLRVECANSTVPQESCGYDTNRCLIDYAQFKFYITPSETDWVAFWSEVPRGLEVTCRYNGRGRHNQIHYYYTHSDTPGHFNTYGPYAPGSLTHAEMLNVYGRSVGFQVHSTSIFGSHELGRPLNRNEVPGPYCVNRVDDTFNLRAMTSEERNDLLDKFPLGTLFQWTEGPGKPEKPSYVELVVDGHQDKRFRKVQYTNGPHSPFKKGDPLPNPLLDTCLPGTLTIAWIQDPTPPRPTPGFRPYPSPRHVDDYRCRCDRCRVYFVPPDGRGFATEVKVDPHGSYRLYCLDCFFNHPDRSSWGYDFVHNDFCQSNVNDVCYNILCEDGNVRAGFLRDGIHRWSDGSYRTWSEPGAEAPRFSRGLDSYGVAGYHGTMRTWSEAEVDKLGIELEILTINPVSCKAIANKARELGLIAERDGSLDRALGVEIVAPPFSFADCLSENGAWVKFLAFAKDHSSGWRAGPGYGMHVSYGRVNIPNQTQIHMIQLVHNHVRLISGLAGRIDNQYNGFSKKTGTTNADVSPERRWNFTKYDSLSVRSAGRLELRVFRSTIDKIGFLKNVEVTQAIRDFSESNKPDGSKFIKYLLGETTRYANFHAWLAREPKRKDALIARAEQDCLENQGRTLSIPSLEPQLDEMTPTITVTAPTPTPPTNPPNLQVGTSVTRAQVDVVRVQPHLHPVRNPGGNPAIRLDWTTTYESPSRTIENPQDPQP